MRRNSEMNGSLSSNHSILFSGDDDSLASYFEDGPFLSAFYEFSQGSGTVQIWDYGEISQNFMRFIVNTPPPDIDSFSSNNYGEKVSTVVSKFEDLYYIALYSQVLDCQARGFIRSVVFVVANQNNEIIKYVHEAYINELIKIVDQIYQNSYKLFTEEIQGYSLSLLKTANATKSLQLNSKLTELKSYLTLFGIDIDNIIQTEEEYQNSLKQDEDFSTHEKQSDDENTEKLNLSQRFNQLNNPHGEIKDESFFTKIDNNLRPIGTLTDFYNSIVYDIQYLIDNLPKTESSAAIAAQIDIESFRGITSLYPMKALKLPSYINSSSEEELKFTNTSSSLFNFDKGSSESIYDDKQNKNILLNDHPIKSTITNKTETKQNSEKSMKPKKHRKNNNKRSKSIQNLKQKTRLYGIDYKYDFNFGGFKGRYSQLVTNILNTNYDDSVFTLQWLLKFKVFHYCAFTILSGGTLVIVTEKHDMLHGKSLADRFSLLAPFSLIRDNIRKIERDDGKSDTGELNIKHLECDSGAESNEYSESQVILVKETVEPRECFKYSIVVTSEIKQSSLKSEESLEKKIDNLNSKSHSKFPTVMTYSNRNDRDDELLSILDLTTNVYRGDGCPDSSFVMSELGSESLFRLGTTQNEQRDKDGSPRKNLIAMSSSSNSFPQVLNSKKKVRSSSIRKTANSPHSPKSQHQTIQRNRQPSTADQIKNGYLNRNLNDFDEVEVDNGSGSGSASGYSGYDNETLSFNQNSMLVSEIENELEVSISETDADFGYYSSLRRGIDGICTYSGSRHGKRSFRGSFISESSNISSSPSSACSDSSESENLFVLNMYARINLAAARFVQKLAEMASRKKRPDSRDELLKAIGFSPEDEPILKYWMHCFFNKQKCRPVLFNNRSNEGMIVITMYK